MSAIRRAGFGHYFLPEDSEGDEMSKPFEASIWILEQEDGRYHSDKQRRDYHAAIRVLELAREVKQVKQAIDILNDANGLRFIHIIHLLQALSDDK